MIPSPGRTLSRFALLSLALLASVAGIARAAVAPEAKAVLDRYVQASGGAALLAERTLHQRSTLSAFGLTGTMESWSARPDRHASRTAIGPLKLRDGFDGRRGWRTDPSGKVLTVDGKDLDDMRASAWFEAEGYLLPDQGGGQVAYVGEESDSLGRYQVLEMTPPAGKPRRLGFDPQTGLLVREVAKDDQRTIVGRFSDFRKVAGLTMAFASTTEIVGAPMNTVRTTLDSVWVDQEVPDSLFAMPADRGGSVRYLKALGVAKLPFDYRGRHLWLRASVNGGPPADFIFDTGASITVIDSAYAAKIGLATEGLQQGQGAGGVGNTSFAQVASLQVAGDDGDGVELKDLKVAVLSVNAFLAPYFWKDAAGIIGFDFIDRFVDEIDYDAHILTLHDPGRFHYEGKGTAIPMTLAGHTPVVKLTLDGALEGDVRVDVGSSSTVDLHGPFVKAHDLVARAPKLVEVTGGGFGGEFKTRVTRMKTLAIGPYSWNEPLVSLAEATTGALSSEDYAGNLGNRILERFKVTIDYERRQMWLEPGRRYGMRDPFTRGGFQLARYGDTIKAAIVLAGSPAEKAGLRRDDVVTAVDGRPLSGLTPDDVQLVFEEGRVGSTHTLAVTRGGKSMTIRVKLADMI